MLGLGKSSSHPGIHRNAAWNCAGTLSDGLIGFFMMPFVVQTLGDTTYGLWALIASLTGCFGFLDLGVRGALGRQLAFHLARRDIDNINATLNTALAILAAAFAAMLVGVVALQFLFFRLFDVSSDQEWMVRLTLLLAGLNLAISFPLSAFDATLWAAQRFDRLNQIDVLVSALKAVLMFVFLKSPATLICLPVISLSGSLLAGSLKIVTTWSALDGLRVGVRLISRRALGDIFAFGVWSFSVSIMSQISRRIPVVVIGSFVGLAAVTPYAIAEKLLSIYWALFSAATGVLTPKSATYSALDDSARQRALFVRGSQLCWAMALFVALGMCLFGRPFITAWFGGKHSQAAVYLAIIGLGSVVPLSQSITWCVLLGIARHQFLAVIAIVQMVLVVVFSLLAATYGTATAVCTALAIASTLGGLAMAWHGCRVMQMRVAVYARETVIPAVVACAVPGAVGTAMSFLGASVLPYAFAAQMALYSLLFAAFCYWMFLRQATVVAESAVQESSLCK